MNILVIQNFGGLGGGSRSGFDIAKMLCTPNNQVSMIIDRPSPQVVRFVETGGISLVTQHPPLMLYNFHAASGFALKTTLRYFIGKKNEALWIDFFEKNIYDLVVLNSSVLCPIAKVLKDMGIRNVIFIRETFRKNAFLNRQQRALIACSDAAIYLTEFDKAAWNVCEKEYVVPDVVDPDQFVHPSETESDDVNFLYMGGLNYYKGALDLLQAIKEVCKFDVDKAFSLTVLGDTYDHYTSFSIFQKLVHFKHVNYRKKCLSIIKEINQIRPNTVRLVGLKLNVSEYYAQCSAVVFPVKKVHQPRPAYEAGYYGKMIIVPDYPNFIDNISDRYNGVYYQKNNIVSLRDCLIEVIKDSDLRENCGKNNQSFVNEYHSLSIASANLNIALEAVMGAEGIDFTNK